MIHVFNNPTDDLTDEVDGIQPPTPKAKPTIQLLGLEYNSDETSGEWCKEAESTKAFDACIAHYRQWFRSYSEVSGVPQLRWDQEPKQLIRIDRVLFPTARLIAEGWTGGPIGVEIKRSKIRVGPAISQILDYRTGLWSTPEGEVRLSYIFLWPYAPCGGNWASLLTNQRIGGVDMTRWNTLRFNTGSVQILHISSDAVHMCATAPAMGTQSGSR